MSLDLCNFLGDWPEAAGEVAARLVRGAHGEELLQMRIELGVLQFFMDGRPDGQRIHGMRSALEFAQRELRLGATLAPIDWAELRRECQQLNCRRLAYTGLAERTLASASEPDAKRYLAGAAADCEACIEILGLFERHDPEGLGSGAAQLPNLVFNRARLRARIFAIDQQFDEAIEAAADGARQLEALSAKAGEDELDENPGVAYLNQLGKRLREQSGHRRTLHEQLDDAIEREDFEAAAQLRDQISRLRSGRPDSLPPPPDDHPGQ